MELALIAAGLLVGLFFAARLLTGGPSRESGDDWCGPPPRDPEADPEPWLTARLRTLLRWRLW